MKFRGWLFLLAVLCVFALETRAADITWDGGAGTLNWEDADNWSSNSVPTATDTAVFAAVVPGGPVVWTGVTPVGGLRVSNGAVTSVSVAIALSADMALPGVGGTALEVGQGDSLVFTSTAARIVTVQGDITLAAGATLTTGTTATLNLDGAGMTLALSDGAQLILGAVLLVSEDCEVIADNSGGATMLTIGRVEIAASVELAWDITGTGDVDVGVTDGIAALGDDALFNMASLLAGGDRRFNIAMGGDFDAAGHDNFEIRADYGYWTISSATTFISAGGYAGCRFGSMLVEAAGSLTIPDGALTDPVGDAFVFYMLEVLGALDAGDNSLVLFGSVFGVDSLMIRVDGVGTFTQTGDVTLGSGTGLNCTLEGIFSFGGEVTVDGAGDRVLVAPGSTVTFLGSVVVLAGGLGAVENGATASPSPVLDFRSDLRVDVAAGLVLGEGSFRFMGNLDLGATATVADLLLLPQDPDNNLAPEIHLTGGIQTAAFEATWGSVFFVTAVGPLTRLSHSGRMLLLGANFSEAFGPGAAWDGTGGDVVLGEALGSAGHARIFGVDACTIIAGVRDIQLGAVGIVQPLSPASANDRARVILTSTAGGQFFMNSLSIEGDSNDDFTGTEANGGDVDMVNCIVLVTTDVALYDSPSADGGGPRLRLKNSVLGAENILIGDGVAAGAAAGSRFDALAGSAVGVKGLLAGEAFSHVSFSFSSLDSADGLAYTVDIAWDAALCGFFNSFVTCDVSADVDISIGGSSVFLVNSTFEHYTFSGVKVAAGSTITAFNNCRFRNGINTGSHMTLSGLGNSNKLNCDENQFDETTGAGNSAIMTQTGANRLNFRCLASSDFGIGGSFIDAALAEQRDGDDNTAPSTQVTWEVVPNQLALGSSLVQPAGLITDGVTNQTLFRFTLNAVGATVNLTQMIFAFEAESPTGGLAPSDIALATLFQDNNNNVVVEPGEPLAGCLDVVVTGGMVTFNPLSAAIAPGTQQIWGIAVSFGPGAAGQYGSVGVICLPPTGVTILETATTIVSGLPLNIADVSVTGPPAQMIVAVQPATTPLNTSIIPAPQVELRDAAGNVVRGRAFNIAVSLLGGDPSAVLTGTLAVATNSLTGRATYTDLRIDRPGLGYVLHFALATPVLAADSTTFNITAATPPPPAPKKKRRGGGGCAVSAGTIPLVALAMLAALTGIGAVARRRAE